MTDRRVTNTGKDFMGDITALCNPSESWSRVSKDEAIRHIDSGLHSYYVQWPGGLRTEIHVVRGQGLLGPYLRTDRDSSQRNNLDELPNC